MSVPKLPTRKIADLDVAQIGLGCMPASWSHDKHQHELGIEAIQAALSAGVTLLDTADIYAPSWNTLGHNEKLVAEAVRTWSGSAEDKARVVIATKGGITRKPGEVWGRNATMDYLLRAVEASAGRLGVEHIDLWQHHRMDPSMTFDEQFENVLQLREQGIVRRIGLSNVSGEMLTRAIELGGKAVVSVQNEWSPRYQQWADVLEICEANDIAFLPWSPLGGRSFFDQLPTRFKTITEIAAEREVSAYVIALAWHLKQSSVIIPIPGASKKASAIDSVIAATFNLSDAEFERIQSSLGESDGLHEELFDLPGLRSS
jgi:aryl-alcohol dehydrogenase-like predicted oxidoreductase